ncbi:MAG: aminotransferase class I/II-fold pyridoxal phosphate-dependent enzyme [Erysipelotrichaceae bacterium]|nr:aminotransferase class I/II-fold pyridoxal phosphate-dependent enzyme [Erysipelotrichaceae bacterium]
MKYDFTSIIDRKGLDSIAAEPNFSPDGWYKCERPDVEDMIPMWVADMNFKTLPDITEKMIERAKHPLFGYFNIRDEYYDAIINWQKDQNNIDNLKRENIGYENGVLGGVVSALEVLAEKAAPVLVNSPTYVGFTHALEDNGYTIIHSPLIKDENGVWRLDYEDMDKKIKAHKIHVAIFCSPHNPCGRVWERWEIEKAMEVYKNNDVYVISDEIWSDLTLYGNKHIPTQSVSEDARNRTVALYAPSKTFNLAGLIGSYHIIYNKYLKDRIDFYETSTHYNSINMMSMYALMGAYSENGKEWVEELRQVLADNVDFAYNYIKENFEGVDVFKPEGTYMLFIDCKQWCLKHNTTLEQLWKAGVAKGVLWQDGRPFHNEYAIRINLALPTSRVKEAFERLNTIFNA